MHQSSNSEQAMQSCLEACELCHRICLQTAMNHCLENGGKHVKAKHIRLMMNCAEICRTTANFQLTGSHFCCACTNFVPKSAKPAPRNAPKSAI